MPRGLPPAPRLPEIEELEYGVEAYWLDNGFRRVLVIPDSECYVVVFDVYAPVPCPSRESAGLAASTALDVMLYYTELQLDDGVYEVVILDAPGGRGCEAISARTRICGAKPGLEELRKRYRVLVKSLEARDPEVEPIYAPEPVPRVYRARGVASPESH